MRIRSFGKSDRGKRREKNEDSLILNDENKVYIVADGMGGHLGGEYASRLAVSIIFDIISAVEKDPEATLSDSEDVDVGDYAGYMRFAISEASKKIFQESTNQARFQGMGTTAVALLFRDKKVYIANVGDSRAYQIRNNKITQITRDHSLVGEQIRAGLISATDSKVNRFKNIITRSVGYQEEVEADIDINVIRENDYYLLCTDGLSNLVKDNEIRDTILNNGDIEQGVTKLIDIANERGGDDNITVLVVKVESLDKEVEKCDDPTVETSD